MTSNRLLTPYVSQFIEEFLTDLEILDDAGNTGAVRESVLNLMVAVGDFDRKAVTHAN